MSELPKPSSPADEAGDYAGHVSLAKPCPEVVPQLEGLA